MSEKESGIITPWCNDCGELNHKCYCDVDCLTCNKKLYKCITDSEDGNCPNYDPSKSY